jgi:hypothetical protein
LRTQLPLVLAVLVQQILPQQGVLEATQNLTQLPLRAAAVVALNPIVIQALKTV